MKKILGTLAGVALIVLSGTAFAAITSRIVPIFYIPAASAQYNGTAGNALLQSHRNGIVAGLSKVADWYSRELPNKNLKAIGLITYRGKYTAAQCSANMDLCVYNDVATTLNLDPWSPLNNRQKLLIIGAGFMGWAGGVGNIQGQGYAVVGMESLMDLPKCAGNWWCTPDYWYGTVAHELGHAYSLPHSTDLNSIMNFHGDWINKHFTGAEPALVESDPATQAKNVNWTSCSIDFACASKWCGTNGGTLPNKVCLPSTAYPK
jgi:Putative peptidase family